MPSLAVHMAIAIEYMKKHKIKDEKAFMDGIKEPDYIALAGQEAKEKAHYSDPRTNDMTTKQKMSGKVNLFNYFSKSEIKTDFQKGYCLHLLSDYFYFAHFFPHKKIESGIPFETVYDDYEKIAHAMEEKYGVNNNGTPWEGKYQEGTPTLFSVEEICNFVEICSMLDLEKIKKITLSSKENWREKMQKEYVDLQKNVLKK